MMFSEQTRTRFDREVAKYPGDQKQSAVMACLQIVQEWNARGRRQGIARRHPLCWLGRGAQSQLQRSRIAA